MKPEISNKTVAIVVAFKISAISWHLDPILLERYNPTIRKMNCQDKNKKRTIKKFCTLMRVERNCAMLMFELFVRKMTSEETAKEKSITEMSNILIAFMKKFLLELVIVFSPPQSHLTLVNCH